MLARSREDWWVGRLGRIPGARDAEKAINSLGGPKRQKQDGVWRTGDEYVTGVCSWLKQERGPERRNSRCESTGWRRQLELLQMPVQAVAGAGGDLVTLGTIQALHSHMVPRVLGGTDRGHFIADILWDSAGLNVDMSTHLQG